MDCGGPRRSKWGGWGSVGQVRSVRLDGRPRPSCVRWPRAYRISISSGVATTWRPTASASPFSSAWPSSSGGAMRDCQRRWRSPSAATSSSTGSGSDDFPPLGVMALWPFTDRFYFADAFVFEAISRRYWLPGSSRTICSRSRARSRSWGQSSRSSGGAEPRNPGTSKPDLAHRETGEVMESDSLPDLLDLPVKPLLGPELQGCRGALDLQELFVEGELTSVGEALGERRVERRLAAEGPRARERANRDGRAVQRVAA